MDHHAYYSNSANKNHYDFTAWKFALRKYKHLNKLFFKLHLALSCVRQLDAGFLLHSLAFFVR